MIRTLIANRWVSAVRAFLLKQLGKSLVVGRKKILRLRANCTATPIHVRRCLERRCATCGPAVPNSQVHLLSPSNNTLVSRARHGQCARSTGNRPNPIKLSGKAPMLHKHALAHLIRNYKVCDHRLWSAKCIAPVSIQHLQNVTLQIPFVPMNVHTKGCRSTTTL
jgi:hypothetical protein